MPDSLVSAAHIQGRMSMDGFGYARTMGIRVVSASYGGCEALIDIQRGFIAPRRDGGRAGVVRTG
jgi:hypothetical protein